MSRARRLLAPLLLLLIVCGGHGLALQAGGRTVPLAPVGALELVVPGLFAQQGAAALWPFEAPAPPARQSLVGAALAPDASRFAWPWTYVGLLPLWLAVIGLWPSRRSSPHRTEGETLVLFGLALLLALVGAVFGGPTFLIVAALSLAAGLGLRRIHPEHEGESARVGPQLVAAGGCVLLTAALIALSLRAGSATDAQALAPLLERLDPGSRARFDPASLALEARHLRAVLDRSALAAFLGMTALLLHLKSRARWSAALLLAVAAADLASVAR